MAVKREIDAERVEALASRFATNEEIAADQNVSADSITRHFAEVIRNGKERGKLSLRAKQYEMAMGGAPGTPAEFLREHQTPEGVQHGDVVRDKNGKPIVVRAEVPASKPNISMLIFLGKQYLEQSDKVKFGGEGDGFEFTK